MGWTLLPGVVVHCLRWLLGDMPSMSKSDLPLPAQNPRVGFPQQAIEGIYRWNNKNDGSEAKDRLPKISFYRRRTAFF
jgi:hypothetical protein